MARRLVAVNLESCLDYTLSLWAMYDLSDNFGYALGVTQQGESNIKDNNSALVLPGYSRIDFAAFYNFQVM